VAAAVSWQLQKEQQSANALTSTSTLASTSAATAAICGYLRIPAATCGYQSNRRLSIRLLRWPKFIKLLLGLLMFSTWVLLPTTLTLLPLLPTLLPTLLLHDALFSSKNIPWDCSIAFEVN
jgi:hypothetical protein